MSLLWKVDILDVPIFWRKPFFCLLWFRKAPKTFIFFALFSLRNLNLHKKVGVRRQLFSLGTGRDNKTNEFSEKIQMVFDPPLLQFFFGKYPKKSIKRSKICNINFWIEKDPPPPVGTFPKIHPKDMNFWGTWIKAL